jgi:glycosyltransferase 2 family protein
LSKRQWIVGLVVLAALIGLVLWSRQRIHFDFGHFWSQFASADWRKMVIALGCIYAGYVLRSARWALLLRHNQRVPLLSLIGTQVIGFTGVALIGRVADLVRPYLVAKKTGLPLSSQIAVYVVERLFDMGSIALIFSIALVSVPPADLLKAIDRSAMLSYMFHHESPWLGLFVFRYSGLILTLFGALFLAAVRWSGEALARFFEHSLGLISKRAGRAAGAKIRAFHAGLDTMHSFGDFAATASLSLVMWGLITTAYLEVMRAFVACPLLATISFSKCVLLMVVSGGASVIQLPVLGWFSQIGIVAAAIAGFFGVPVEPATACAAALLLITFLGIVPVGLVWAQIENVSLRKIAVQSEHAEEELADNKVPGNAVN